MNRRNFLQMLAVGAAALSTKKYFDLAANTWRNDEIFPEFDPDNHVIRASEYAWFYRGSSVSIIVSAEEIAASRMDPHSFATAIIKSKLHSLNNPTT